MSLLEMAAAILPTVFTKKLAKVYIIDIFSTTILQRSLANFGEKKLEDVVEKKRHECLVVQMWPQEDHLSSHCCGWS